MTDSHIAVRDDLFGLPDRRPMHEAIGDALEHLRAGGEPAAVLLVEVDGLDAPEDGLAVALAARLGGSLRSGDLVTRFGGRVVVVVARDVSDEFAAHELGLRLKRTLEEPPDGGSGRVRASVGASLLRADDPSLGVVVARADAAMYAAKNMASRDARAAGAGPRESTREARIEAAFERSSIGDFDVYYQPIANLRSGSVVAVEALLRWEHPDLEAITPAEFLAVAERHGQMITLGRSVIEKACTQTVRWAATRDGLPMRTCVNVAPSQIADPAFVEDVMSALALHGATGHQLTLELTDQTLAAAPAGVLETLAAARIELALDGIGTRLPSAEQLARLPIASVKLDRSWIAQGHGGEPPAILGQVVELASSLGLPAIAQGIETLDQLAMVRESGFALAQGHLFSRPESGPSIERLVLRERPFATLLAPRPAWLDLQVDGDEPAIELDAPAVS